MNIPKSINSTRRGFLALVLAAGTAILAPVNSANANLLTGNSFSGGIFDVNTATGAATSLSTTTTVSLAGIAYQPGTGDLFGLTTIGGTPANSLVRIDPITGAVTNVGATGLPRILEGDLAFNPVNGLLYGVQNSSGSSPGSSRSIFQLNTLTGAASVLGTFLSSVDLSAIAFDSAGTLFGIDTRTATSSGNAILLTLDPTNGAFLTSVTTNLHLGAAAGIAFDPVTGIAYVADGDSSGTNTLYTLNTTTGVFTSVGPLGNTGGLAGLSFAPSANSVPDGGGTLVLLGLALPGLLVSKASVAWLRRRRAANV